VRMASTTLFNIVFIIARLSSILLLSRVLSELSFYNLVGTVPYSIGALTMLQQLCVRA
jgi:hypothetical protein